MFKIKTLNKISPSGMAFFDADNYTVSDDEMNPDAIIVRSAKMHDMPLADSLVCVARAGAGYNNVPVEECSKRGIVVFNTPGGNANAVRELAVCALMLASRKVTDAIDWAKSLADKGAEVPALVEKGKNAFTGPEISGKTLGVIGLGAVGGPLANAANYLGMLVYGCDPFISVEAAWGLSRSVIRANSNKFIYENSDYISLHAPLNNETKGMINAETLASMKDGVRIINLSRGELVDDDAMAAALESGKVACYVTDFPNEKTLKMKNTVSIPHLGASTPESEDNCAEMAARQIKDYLESGIIRNSVNFPNTDLPMSTKYRLCVIHHNIPNVISQISGVVAKDGINIEDMVNRSRGDNACTLLDVNSELPAMAVEHIASVEGVISVRVVK